MRRPGVAITPWPQQASCLLNHPLFPDLASVVHQALMTLHFLGVLQMASTIISLPSPHVPLPVLGTVPVPISCVAGLLASHLSTCSIGSPFLHDNDAFVHAPRHSLGANMLGILPLPGVSWVGDPTTSPPSRPTPPVAPLTYWAMSCHLSGLLGCRC